MLNLTDKHNKLNQLFALLTHPQYVIEVTLMPSNYFFLCFTLNRNLVANNFVTNRLAHILISPQVLKYNHYVLSAYRLDS